MGATAVASIPRLSDAQRMAIRKDALEHLPAGKIVIESPAMMKVGDKRKINTAAGIGIDVCLKTQRRETKNTKVFCGCQPKW